MNQYAKTLEQLPRNVSWRAALYIRLSKEDGDKNESYSVTSQREILKEYIKQRPDIFLFDYYVDDGWSGTNFDRPAFRRMMQDIYDGKVNCVVVKDLSRFGRNYTDAGHYLDDVFVRLGVRFIALNNGVDSISSSMNAATKCITVGVQNVINESVAATTSVNVRGTLNVSRKQGKFIGSFPTYGYLKDPNDHHKLIVDEETAPVVRQIFQWFLSGKSIIGITKTLNAMGIPNPSTYKMQKGWNYRHTSGKRNDGLWCDSTVRRMLSNQMYIGNMVQGKNTTISYKIKQCKSVPKSDWIVVENTHAPIIDKETFEKAQSLFHRNTRTAPAKTEVDLFSGFVKCADCHRAMSKKTNRHPYGTYQYYRCVTSRKMDSGACSPHSIRIDKLERAVLVTIQTMIDTAVEWDDVLAEIRKKADGKSENLTKKSMEKCMAERERIQKMMLDLYPDWKSGTISKEEYLALKENMGQKIKALDEKIEAFQRALARNADGCGADNAFLTHFKKYGKIKKLTRPILTELVDSILVHEGGNITINFKFKDAYEQIVDYMEEAKKKHLEESA
ncbi:MAG: recombinase family protein [Clostridiales bacterium]|nr:recombinase family protein [Clostridiales bacterium]